MFTTHGGRTTSPVVDGDLVIVKAASSTWGTQGNRSIRLMAFDKRTGETVWISTPGGRPFDTDYSQPVIARINGTRLLITGLGDGGVHAVKVATGEPVWHFLMSKRAINTAPVLNGTTVLASHGQENLEGNEMGMLAAIDGTAKGNIPMSQAKWTVKGFIGEFSSGLVDGDRYLQVDNAANLYAFDVVTGRQLWKQNLGTVQKASPVFGDGKIYVGTETGKFFILRPHSDRCEVLSEVEMPISETGIVNERVPEPVVASAAISRGRVYFVSSDTLYAIGKKSHPVPASASTEEPPPPPGQPAWVQVVPTELILTAGQTANFRARLFDEHGQFLREEKASWSLDGLKGSVEDGRYRHRVGPRRPGRSDKSHGRFHHWRSSRARGSAAALERNLRFLRRGCCAPVLGRRHRRPIQSRRTRWPEGARKGSERDAVQAHARFLRSHRLVELHRGSRHARARKAPPDG